MAVALVLACALSASLVSASSRLFDYASARQADASAREAEYAEVEQYLHSTQNLGCEALHPNVVIYNRVPKSGSSSMRRIIGHLSRIHGFQFYNSPNFFNSEEELADQFEELCTRESRCVYINHMHYPYAKALQKLTDRNLTFALINVIRRPLAQVRSDYEFHRFGHPAQGFRLRYQREYNGSFADCVHVGHEACSPSNLYFRFFSDRDIEQTYNLERHVASGTLLNTIGNIKKFAVIGVVERWQDTLAVFEKVLPDFFRGAREVDAQMQLVNKTPKMTFPATEMYASDVQDARRVLYHTRFSIDNALYDYMETRFAKQFETCDFSSDVQRAISDSFLFEMQEPEV